MIALSAIVAAVIIGIAVYSSKVGRISTWLMWIVVTACCGSMLVCNTIIYSSYGYKYSEFWGTDDVYT